MQASFTYSELYDTFSRSLSIIGKRATDDKGELIFKDITLSSREEVLAHDYFSQAAIDIASAISDAINAFNTTPTGFSLTVRICNEALGPVIKKAFEDYCVSHALYSWFNVTAPTISERYLADRNRRMGTILTLVYSKQPPFGNDN